jgi:hypothetical protein
MSGRSVADATIGLDRKDDLAADATIGLDRKDDLAAGSVVGFDRRVGIGIGNGSQDHERDQREGDRDATESASEG